MIRLIFFDIYLIIVNNKYDLFIYIIIFGYITFLKYYFFYVFICMYFILLLKVLYYTTKLIMVGSVVLSKTSIVDNFIWILLNSYKNYSFKFFIKCLMFIIVFGFNPNIVRLLLLTYIGIKEEYIYSNLRNNFMIIKFLKNLKLKLNYTFLTGASSFQNELNILNFKITIK